MKRRPKVIGITVILFVGLIYLFTGPVYRLVGMHCDYTGSYEHWTQYPFGIRRGISYELSPLEDFLTKNLSVKVEHKWVSFQGTGKNVFGKTVFFGHGRPNALLLFPRSYLKLFVEHSPKEDVFELHDVLRRGDKDEIRARVYKLYDECEMLAKRL